MAKLQTCTRCIMDTTDPKITFDGKGVCSHCHKAEGLLRSVRFTREESERRLRSIADRIRTGSMGRDYDSIIGLSGGADSSYTAHIAHQLGLRPLAVHFDNGWNSEIAVSNIKNIVRTFGWDLVTYVINWEEFRDIQRAFFCASVIDIEMITDHAIMAAMFRIAREHHIRFILSGQNYATEHCMPKSWIWNKQDLRNLKTIHKRFGEAPLKTFPMMSTWRLLVYRRLFFEYVLPLNNINYRKQEAIEELKREVGWRDYGGKHFESVFTKFYQAYILPRKFGVDKRKPHLSALIRNGEITRDQALEELGRPYCDPVELERDREYVLKKLGFSEAEFDAMMLQDRVDHDSYGSDKRVVKTLLRVYHFLKDLHLVSARDS
jgi:N-acetyl sugar amidotransferase